MDITIKTTGEPIEKQEGWHILTVAESGFSMLSGYAGDYYNIDGEMICEFEEKVNKTNQAGSLHPLAPISAIPCKFFREHFDSTDSEIIQEFESMISDFLNNNSKVIQAKNLVIDFRVSPEPINEKYIDTVVRIFNQQNDNIIKRIIIYNNQLTDRK